MREVERRTELPASADRIFAFIADLEKLPSWQSGIVSAHLTTAGPIGIGTVARVERRLAGQQLIVDIEVAGFEPGRRLVLESETSGIRVQATLLLEPIDPGRTGVAFSMQIRAGNVFMAPLEGMVAGAAASDIEESLKRLQHALSIS
ncbi:MAG: hypothetical protein DLM71_07160 [Chloroflexi bacterium]|nr:MAG: hypothetical protein DLM71_07160 [Chloroflexota bacterium]